MAELRKVIATKQSADKPLAGNAKSPSIQHDSLITARKHADPKSTTPTGAVVKCGPSSMSGSR